MKEELTISAYLTGLCHMASSLSTWMGPSYLEVDCFKKENWQQDFTKHYNLKQKDLKLTKTTKNLKEMLHEFFIEKDILDSLEYWITTELEEPINIYESPEIIDDLSFSAGANSTFYIVEDIYFVEFKDIIACFIMGNNE